MDDVWAEMQKEEQAAMRRDAEIISQCPNTVGLYHEPVIVASPSESISLDVWERDMCLAMPTAPVAAERQPSASTDKCEPASVVRHQTEWSVVDTLKRESGHISAEDASVRRRALERLHGALPRLKTPAAVAAVFAAVWRPLLKRFADAVERCRDLAVRTFLHLVERVDPAQVSETLGLLFPVLLDRIGPPPGHELQIVELQGDTIANSKNFASALTVPRLTEDAEEVRLLEIVMLNRLVAIVGKGLKPHLIDICDILGILARFFLSISRSMPTANAKGTRVDRKVPKGARHPETLPTLPSDSISPSAFAVGTSRKVAKNRRSTRTTRCGRRRSARSCCCAARCGRSAGLFLTTVRGMPTANAEG